MVLGSSCADALRPQSAIRPPTAAPSLNLVVMSSSLCGECLSGGASSCGLARATIAISQQSAGQFSPYGGLCLTGTYDSNAL